MWCGGCGGLMHRPPKICIGRHSRRGATKHLISCVRKSFRTHRVHHNIVHISNFTYSSKRSCNNDSSGRRGGDEEALGYQYRNPEHCLIGCVINLGSLQESPIFNNGISPFRPNFIEQKTNQKHLVLELVTQYFLDSKKRPTSQSLFEYNSLNLSATVFSTKLLRRCRHPRVPVKSPSSTCCRPTTFFWCGSRVDAIELLLFRGQNSIKKQSSTTLLAPKTALLSQLAVLLTAVVVVCTYYYILCYSTNTKLATSRK